MRTLDTGWFAKKDVFSYLRPEPPEFGAGGDAWLESTPPVLAPFQALAGLGLAAGLGVAPPRGHSLGQEQRGAPAPPAGVRRRKDPRPLPPPHAPGPPRR